MARAWVFGDDLDTDQMVPGRYAPFMVGQDKFYTYAFCDARPGFATEVRPGDLLVGGENFGCGSSREHSPWALVDFGFRAVISTSFADIFCNNSLKNGLLPIVVDPATHEKLFCTVNDDPSVQVGVDLASQTLALPGGETVVFPIDPFSKKCLLDGVDELGYLLKFSAAVAEYEASHPMSGTRPE